MVLGVGPEAAASAGPLRCLPPSRNNCRLVKAAITLRGNGRRNNFPRACSPQTQGQERKGHFGFLAQPGSKPRHQLTSKVQSTPTLGGYRLLFATTLLASVERCSRPDICTKSAASPPRCLPAWSGVRDQISARNRLLRHHAARQRGAVFKMLDAVAGRWLGLGRCRPLVLNMAPRWQAAWWPKKAWSGAMSGSEHGFTLASSVVAEEVARRGDVWF